MLQSKLFSKTRKEGPRDEVSKNANLLIRAGFINKEMAGVYSYLPLGLRVLNKVNDVIRDEMNKAGGVELFLTTLQDKSLWEKTDRWSDEKVDNWFKTKLKNGTEVGLGFTHEEALTELMKNHIRSYKDLPVYPYQIQTKFRNEARAKSGIIRSREFMMKDLYSFSRNENEHLEFYAKMRQAYRSIFNRVGIGDKTYLTHASGGTFSKFSHEFQTVTEAGEDIIYVSKEKANGETVAINKEIFTSDLKKDLGLDKSEFKEMKAIEVGNIFTLGTRFSEPLGLVYLDEKGQKTPVFMGSYGIGPGRVIGTVVELMSDDKGIVWPVSVAPFKVHLVEITSDNKKVRKTAEDIYEKLAKLGVEVLYDDRDVRAGEKFNDSDLIGIPLRVVVSEKGIEKGEFEVKERKDGKVSILKEKELLNFINKYK